MKEDKIIKPFFSHDECASSDGKILKLYRDFRKLAKAMSQEELESFVANGAYGIFWRIVEFMHGNNLPVDDTDILADELRVDVKFVEKILNDFELFRKQNGCYVSDRILRNKNYVEKKNEEKQTAANVRWLLSAFNKAYVEFFNEEPVLSADEIEALKKYNEKIPCLKQQLRDILYTLSTLKFDTKTNFKPCANWLLKDNNLARLYNGEFGKLKHKKTEKELREEQRKKEEQFARSHKPTELEIQAEKISGRVDALDFIYNYYIRENRPLNLMGGRVMVLPTLRSLMMKFDITDKEVIEKCQL